MILEKADWDWKTESRRPMKLLSTCPEEPGSHWAETMITGREEERHWRGGGGQGWVCGVLSAGLSISLDTLGGSQNKDAELWLLLWKSRTKVILCLDAEKQELLGELDRNGTLRGSCARGHGNWRAQACKCHLGSFCIWNIGEVRFPKAALFIWKTTSNYFLNHTKILVLCM